MVGNPLQAGKTCMATGAEVVDDGAEQGELGQLVGGGEGIAIAEWVDGGVHHGDQYDQRQSKYGQESWTWKKFINFVSNLFYCVSKKLQLYL